MTTLIIITILAIILAMATIVAILHLTAHDRHYARSLARHTSTAIDTIPNAR